MILEGAKHLIIASLFFSIINALVKLYSHIPAIEIVFFRSVVSLGMSYYALRKLKVQIFNQHLPLLLLRGASGAAGLSLFFYSIQNMPLATAVTVFYLAPIFTVILAMIINKEYPKKAQWPFILLGFVGAALMKNFDPRADLKTFFIAVTAAFFAGLAYNFIRLLKNKAHHQLIIFFFPLVTIPVCLPFLIPVWKTPNWPDLLGLIGIGVLTQFAQIFMTKAYMAEEASKISHYNYLTAVWALLTGIIFFGELLNWLSMAGMAVIIFSVVMSTRIANSKTLNSLPK